MRETRQSGSEGGGAGTTGSPYPYRTTTLVRTILRGPMVRSSRTMTYKRRATESPSLF